MKKVKVFVRQREKPEGSMAEGYVVYESFYYASDYIKKIDHTPGSMIWDDEHDKEKREWEVLEINRKGAC